MSARLESRLVVSKRDERADEFERGEVFGARRLGGPHLRERGGSVHGETFLDAKAKDSTAHATRPTQRAAAIAFHAKLACRRPSGEAAMTRPAPSSPRQRASRALPQSAFAAPAGAQSPLPLDRIKLPPGFAIEMVARAPSARAMTWGSAGHAVRGLDARQRVRGHAARARAARARAGAHDRERSCATRRGVAFRDGALYVSAVSRIVRFDDIETRLDAPPRARRSSPTRCRATATTAASSSPSVPTASSTCRSARRATSACPTPSATRSSRA